MSSEGHGNYISCMEAQNFHKEAFYNEDFDIDGATFRMFKVLGINFMM